MKSAKSGSRTVQQWAPTEASVERCYVLSAK
jgi:hypothetical protein